MTELENTRAAELVELLEQRSLTVGVRGYDRGATDRLLAQLDEGLKVVVLQQAATQSRLSDLERRIADGQGREEAVTEALVLATQIRGESEREGKEIRDRYVSEAEGIKEEAQRRADEVVRQAETRAQTIVGEAEANVHAFDQQIHDAQELAQRVRSHLITFLRSMLDEVERRNGESASIVGDLLVRAGQTAESVKEEAVAPSPAGYNGGGARGSGGELRDGVMRSGGSDRSASE